MTNLRHIGYIDGLRGLAVLLVMVDHIAVHGGASGPFAHLAMEGAHGVDLFFVISGFCLAFPTLAKYASGRPLAFDLAGFAVKRLVRIIPPYYLAVAALLGVSMIAVALHRDPIVEAPGSLSVIAQLAFLDRNVQLINPSFWTLMVEFRWYFVFPIVLFVWLKSPRAFVAIGVSAALLYAFTRARGLDLGALPGFMLGIIAADIFAGARMPERVAAYLKRIALPAVVTCAGIGFFVESGAALPGFDGNEYVYAYQPTIAAWQLAVFFGVVAAGASPRLRAVFSGAWIAGIGVASYSIYLVHEPIVSYVVQKLPGLAGAVVAMLVCIGAGAAFWAILERPFTAGPLRERLLRAVATPIHRGFGLIGVPLRFTLPSKAGEAEPPLAFPASSGLAAGPAAMQ